MRGVHLQLISAFSVVLVVTMFPFAQAQAQETQETTSFVLLVPEEVRAEWTAALSVELAPRGARVIAAEPPAGRTALLRDAEALRVAIEHGAFAAARVDADDGGWTLHVIARDASEARSTRVGPGADPRTFALILTSLLDEPAFVPTPVRTSNQPSSAPAATDAALDAPAPVSTDEAQNLDRPASAEPQKGGDRWSFRVGAGGFAVFNDVRFIPGAMFRTGVGFRASYFEAAFLFDAGVMYDSVENEGVEIQPLLRICLELGAALPMGEVLAFHIGARGCSGIAEFRAAGPPFIDGYPVYADRASALLSAGGLAAFSVALANSVRLYFRADIEGTALKHAADFGQVFAVLSTMVSFH